MTLSEKLLGNSLPVTFKRMAFGMNASRMMMTAKTTVSTQMTDKANRLLGFRLLKLPPANMEVFRNAPQAMPKSNNQTSNGDAALLTN